MEPIKPLPPEPIPVDPPAQNPRPLRFDIRLFLPQDERSPVRKVLEFIKARAKEVSSIIGALIVLVPSLPVPVIDEGIDIIVRVAGFVLMLWPDKQHAPAPPPPADPQ